ncbi:MAG: BlaI/MecI/CopY family transcriptional regulator [Terriglobales bacterium]
MKGRLAELELECMKVLWKYPGASVAQVRAGLPRPLAYTTVMTVLDRMSAKGLVGRQKNGRAYLYTAALDLETARRSAVGRLAARFFDNDPAALARYASRLRMSKDDRDEDEAALAPVAHRGARPVARRPAVFPSHMDDSLL